MRDMPCSFSTQGTPMAMSFSPYSPSRMQTQGNRRFRLWLIAPTIAATKAPAETSGTLELYRYTPDDGCSPGRRRNFVGSSTYEKLWYVPDYAPTTPVRVTAAPE